MKREKKNLIFLIAGIVLVSLLGVVFYQSALPTVQSFYTDQTSLVMDIHSEDNLKFHADPERCKYGKVEYISSDPDVLSVIPDETDKLTCKLVSFDLEGTAQIQIRQVQKNGVSATVFVKVEDKSLIAELKEDAERVDQLIGQLDLNQLSYSDKSSVEECRTAYNALSDRALQYVTLESNLVRAENEIKKIEASYQKQAEAVADQVDAVGEVTLEKAQLIEQCRMAYDALNDEAKQFVTNLAVLEEAEEELDFCRSADELDQLILSIGEVTLEKEEAVMRVYSAYSRLPESAKKKVQRYGILTAAVVVINTLKADKAEAERQAEEARKLAELEEQRSTEENTGYGIVYWTPKGKSYHSRESCPTLSRSKTILSGSVSEAKNSGHGDPCNICAGGS